MKVFCRIIAKALLCRPIIVMENQSVAFEKLDKSFLKGRQHMRDITKKLKGKIPRTHGVNRPIYFTIGIYRTIFYRNRAS